MNINDFPKRCELVNGRIGHLLKFALSPVCKFATKIKKFLRAVFDSRVAWVGKDSGRVVKRGWVVGQKKLCALCAALIVLVGFVLSSLDVFAAGQPTAPEIELKLDRIENNISNLTSVVEMLQQQIANLNTSVGGSLSTNVSDFGAAFNSFVDTWKKVVGSTPTANHTLTWSMENMRLNLQQLLNSVRNDIVPALNGISNSLSQVDFEALHNSVGAIEQLVEMIWMDVYEIRDILRSMLDLQDEWSNAQTNLLSAILDKINDLAETVHGGDSGGGAAIGVRVEGGVVDVGEVQVDPSGLWDFSWSLAVNYLRYLRSVAGEDQWDADFIQSESESVSDSGNDYRSGVISGFQNLMAINSQILENNHRLLLFLNQSADLEDVKNDLNHQLDLGENETEASGADVQYSVDYISGMWDDFHTSFKRKIDETLDTSGFDISSAPPALLSFSGGSIMGFEYETFTLDFSNTLSDGFAEIIRSWMLFFYSASCIFIVLRLIPFGMIRFAGLMFMLFNINKNLQK